MTATLVKMQLPRLSKQASLRALGAGIAWGVIFSGGMIAYARANCGFVCLDDAALMIAISVAAGIVTIGPVAAFGRARSLAKNAPSAGKTRSPMNRPRRLCLRRR